MSEASHAAEESHKDSFSEVSPVNEGWHSAASADDGGLIEAPGDGGLVDAPAEDGEFGAAALDEDYLEEGQYWRGDTGSLAFDARRVLLQLLRGPLITADRNKDLWQALANNEKALKSRLADLFLELVIDHESGIAFVRNVTTEDTKTPKAVRSQPLTLADTIMVLTLRKELLIDSFNRVYMSRDDLIEQLAHYRPITKLDESAFKKRLETSWSRLVTAGILQPIDSEERCEVSPVLKLIFGVEEVKAINAEFELLLSEGASVEEDFDEDNEFPEEVSSGGDGEMQERTAQGAEAKLPEKDSDDTVERPQQ